MTTSIKYYFDNIFVPGVHYIAIGCAALLKEKKIDCVPNSKMQQFPPFLQEIKQKYNDVPMTILLIDPELEPIPVCIVNKDIKLHDDMCFESSAIWNNKKILWSRNHNVFYTKNVTIYCFNTCVDYWHSMKSSTVHTNIYNNLLDYQQKIIDTKSLLFMHDYSGRSMIEFAQHMDDKLCHNIKYVMYDITTRTQEISCDIDLTNDIFYPVLNNDMTIHNPFLLKEQKIGNKLDTMNRKIKLLSKIKHQTLASIQVKIDYFNHNIIPFYSQIKTLLADINTNIETRLIFIGENMLFETRELSECKIKFNEFVKSREIILLQQVLQDIHDFMFVRLGYILDIYIYDQHTKECIISDQKYLLHTVDDVYKWRQSIISDITKQIKNLSINI